MSALATGALSGVPMPVTAGTLTRSRQRSPTGAGDRDLAELARFVRERMLRSFEPEVPDPSSCEAPARTRARDRPQSINAVTVRLLTDARKFDIIQSGPGWQGTKCPLIS